ncbi:hypothetical protein C0995_010646 [Termitomyces sp. Mi166|nr:hypothetical protein C0995_010646 [Termitomyces sp. Mi166\
MNPFQFHIKVGINCSLYIRSDAVAIYGSIGPDNGLYAVQLDDEHPGSYSARTATYGAKSLLYYGSNIGSGNHSLVIRNQADENLEIDYANVYTLSLNSLALSPVPTSAVQAKYDVFSYHFDMLTVVILNRLSAGAIAGISVAAASVIILVFLAGFLVRFSPHCEMLFSDTILVFTFKVGSRRLKKLVYQQNEHSLEPQFTFGTSEGSTTVEDPTLISPFRLLRPTADSTQADLKKSNDSIIRASTVRSNMTASTLIAEGASNVPSLRGPREAQRKPDAKQAFFRTPIYESG